MNIKSTDIVASFKLLYGMIMVPIFLILTDIAVLLIFIYAVKLSIGYSFLYAFIFSIAYPLYLYLVIVFIYDSFMFNGRMILIFIKLFCFCSEKRGIRELKRLKLDLRKNIIDLINDYSDVVCKDDPERLTPQRPLSDSDININVS